MFVVVAAYTGTGKTTFALQCASYWAAQGVSVMFFGTEQSAGELTVKQACLELDLPFPDARRGALSPSQAAQLEAAIASQAVGDATLTYYPGSSPTGDEVVSAIRAGAAAGVSVFVLDYLGAFDLTSAGAHWQQMKGFVKGLKDLAVELGVIIVGCAQLGELDGPGAWARHTKPHLSAIQGGSAVRQYADLVLGIYQPLRKGVTEGQKKAALASGDVRPLVEPRTAAVVAMKCREGSDMVGSVSLYWVQRNRFIYRPPGESVRPGTVAGWTTG